MHVQDYSGHGLFMLVAVFLLTYLLLTFYNPRLVQRRYRGHATGENDPMVTMLWSFFISMVVLVVLGMLMYAFMSR